jgi:hypothetical protein
MGRPLLVLLAVLCALPAPAAAQAPPPPATPEAAFAGDGMWIWQLERSERGDVARVAARARAAGLSFVVVKAAHGRARWPQFDRPLVEALHAAGLRVCAYQRALARGPAQEARVLAGAVARGADCLVVDAEAEYEGRHAAARTYMRALRAQVGAAFPVALTSFPLVSLHPRFPYAEFLLGPGGAQVTMPQVYWDLIGMPVERLTRRTWAENARFGRPIHPIGQLFHRPRAADVRRFRALAAAAGAPGVSWWAWEHARAADWRAAAAARPQSARRTPASRSTASS